MQTPVGYATSAKRPVRAGRLARHHLQPVLSLSHRAHRVRRLPDDGAGGGRGRRLASVARPHQRGRHGRRARHVLHGHGHDHRGGAAADPGGRPARAEHARAPAGQGHGHGRPLQELQRRRAADPVRLARRGQGRDALRHRDSQGLVADPETFVRRAAQGPRFGGPQGMAAGRHRVLVLPHHGRAGHGDAGARRSSACWRASGTVSTTGRCCISWRWPWGRPASWR